jgi:hypothetical protein
VLAVTRVAAAQPAEKAEAEQLFDAGRKLLAEGKPDEACAKFEASILKDPRAVGTLLNLGLCKERSGKVASALQLFREAYDRANEADMPVQREAAQQHIAALTPQVPVVTLRRGGTPARDTKLVIDDVVLPPETTELPIDPGHHEVLMTAPGRLPYQTTFDIRMATRVELVLPALDAPIVGGGGRRQYGKAALVGGSVLVVAASGLAGWAWHRYDTLFEDGSCREMDGERICDAHGVEVADRSQLQGNIATVVGAIGVAALVTGAVLIWTAPRGREQRVVPVGSRDRVGLAVLWTF